MNWFFFGSLMCPAVLEVVLGRAVEPAHCQRASLPGYRRYRVRGESYPAVRPQAGEAVDGLMVEGLSADEGLRVIYFEGEEYRPAEVQLLLHNGQPCSAVAFLATNALALSDEGWDLAPWRAAHLADFLPRAEAWMSGYGEARSVADNEAIWGAREES